MKQARSLSEFSCLFEYTRLYPTIDNFSQTQLLNIYKSVFGPVRDFGPYMC